MRTPHNERLTSDTADRAHPRPLPQAGGERDLSSVSEASRSGVGDGPQRRCILSRDTRARGELTRLALSPDGRVLPDVQARAPGRGAWIGVDRAALEKALSDGPLKRALARAFGTAALDIPADLPARVQEALLKLLLDRLGLELRAGNLVLGAQRIEKAAREGRVAMLFHAADARADGAAKLDQAWRVGSDREGSGAAGARLPLDRAALSVALGRDNVVHLALLDAGAARRIGAIVERVTQYLGVGATGSGLHERAGQYDAAGTGFSAGQKSLKD